jgi:hypothetical protein
MPLIQKSTGVVPFSEATQSGFQDGLLLFSTETDL